MNRQLEDELKKYSKLCNDEMGEYSNLLSILNSFTCCMSKEFKLAYEKEFIEQLEYFRKNTEIVLVRVVNEYDREELRFKDE